MLESSYNSCLLWLNHKFLIMIVFPFLIPGQNYLFPGTGREITKCHGKGNLRLAFPGIRGNGNSRSPLLPCLPSQYSIQAGARIWLKLYKLRGKHEAHRYILRWWLNGIYLVTDLLNKYFGSETSDSCSSSLSRVRFIKSWVCGASQTA